LLDVPSNELSEIEANDNTANPTFTQNFSYFL